MKRTPSRVLGSTESSSHCSHEVEFISDWQSEDFILPVKTHAAPWTSPSLRDPACATMILAALPYGTLSEEWVLPSFQLRLVVMFLLSQVSSV